ncbi:MAG: Demethylmenaquinone methyltransferase [Planctomycetota bacterium]|jgi:S-adenosylmethionine-diacylgycerolhomoserine-N-methlytransferase
MSLLSDLKILYHMALRPIRGKSHAERLENFYSGQAEAYDDFRKRLLKGREELWKKIGPRPGATWVDMGGGTGANLEFFGSDIQQLKKVYVVDLAGSLLKVAQQRAEKNQWANVQTVEADATRWQPTDGPVDVVTFSYSLTMIPDWFAAIDNALTMLKPGGLIGVVDFYVSRKHPDEGLKRHGWSTRSFWPIWFSNDNVYPSSEHLPYLRHRFESQWLSENRAKVPYLPLVRTPYYQFIGHKKS